ncbi:MAG: N-6 DNA methylase [Prevotella sp.]|jgi:type I restriction enzyme M protein|nr:N-6 DNA methylase [Prevotella sp.]
MSLEVQIKNNKIFAPVLGKWLSYNKEEEIRQEFICRLVNSQGYQLKQLGQDIEIKNRQKVDVAIWRSEQEKLKNSIPAIIITVKCSAEHVRIKDSDYATVRDFASIVNANFFIAVNSKETKIFHIQKDSTPKKLERIKGIPDAEILLDDKKIEKYIEENKVFSRDEFSKLLTRCHNIIRNNDKLSPEAAFDEISKILFMKIMFEKKLKGEMVFSKSKFQLDEENYEKVIRPHLKKTTPVLDKDYMQYLFDETKENFEKDDIFEKGDIIRIKRNSFETIVEELEMFNLSDISDDVKGIAFEQFLGKTFRGELGQFFTPRTIVDFMVDILDPQEGETVCDPCCGSGGFLIKAFEHIQDKINEDIKNQIKSIKENQKDIDAIQNAVYKIDAEFDKDNPNSRYHKLSYDCIFGADANPRMARTAKMNMIMHGDGHGGVHHHDGLLDVNGIHKNRFDVILTNPPFGARIEKSQVVSETDLPTEEQAKRYMEKYPNYEKEVLIPLKNDVAYNKGKGLPILNLYQTGSMSTLTEVLFIERCLNLLKPGGRMGIVLPEGILNNTNLQKIREFVESKAKILLVVSIPQDVFIASGATVKPSLLFFKKFTEEEAEKYARIVRKSEKEINRKYDLELTPIIKQLALRGENMPDALTKKKLNARQKEIETKRDAEIKAMVKKEFDYRIVMAKVEKAGISTTGQEIENELIPLKEEFTKYRESIGLWDVKNNNQRRYAGRQL